MSEAVVAPPPATPPASPTPAPLAPGWRSSEAWVTLLTMILGAIPSSGLTTDAPLLAKIVGMAIAALAALHYTAQRTALKRAHLAALGTAPTVAPSQISKVPQLAVSAASAAVVALVVAIGISHGCSGSAGTGPIAPIAAGGSAFLQCEKQDLTQLVGNKTLLATVAADLLEGNYAQAIADLIGKVGNDAVGCAVLAIAAVDSAGKTSGPQPQALTPRETRAKELIAKYSWKIATSPATSPAASSPAPSPAPPSAGK